MPTRRSFASLGIEEDDKKNEIPLTELLTKCKGKSFEQFWDLIGRQEKHGKKLGVLSYEKTLFDVLEKTRHCIVVKPVGCGITHFSIMWLLFKIMTGNEFQNSQVCIVVGPSVRLADRILGRIRKLLEPHEVLFNSARNYLFINKTELFSVPSHNLNALRSLENPSVIYVSEADYLPELSDVRECTERYISKSNPWILMESTINLPTGLYAQIWKEEPCLYERVRINYLDAIAEGMYTQREINKAKQSRSFQKELLCDFSATAIGNTFPSQWVDRAYQNYNIDTIQPTRYILAIDPGWSPARTGITLLGVDHDNQKIIVVSDEYSETEDSILSLVTSLCGMYNVNNIFIDASDKRFIKRVKRALGEREDYEEYIKFLKENKILSQYNPLKNLMMVIPLLFTQVNNQEMLSYARLYLEQSTVMIPSNCSTLQSALFSAKDVDGQLLKFQLSHGGGGDCLDSFRMALWGADN